MDATAVIACAALICACLTLTWCVLLTLALGEVQRRLVETHERLVLHSAGLATSRARIGETEKRLHLVTEGAPGQDGA